ncbi:46L [Xanthomonas phage Xp10]|uniref:46L n=1 Tax=Xanthomonas phage Xp10 TaxID=2907956 RepID=Q7Y5H0_9CAUD|nr:hypothetical protein Xp10p47 [Xanthomonas phage Xp10]AAP58714.1 46L [Xanthomonas phage Xp10]
MTMTDQEILRSRHDEAISNVRKLRKQAAQLKSLGLWREPAQLDRKANVMALKSLDLIDDIYPGQDWW